MQKVLWEPDKILVENALAVATRLAERAPEADKQRKIHSETVSELHEAGLLTMGIPRSLGGTEADIVTLLHVYETLGGACASTAWCVGNHTAACRKLHESFGEAATPYMRAVVDEGAVIAQGIVPTGDTQAANGGFISKGRWPFMSFSSYARWALLSTMIAGPPPGWKPSGEIDDPPKSHNRQLLVSMNEPGIHLDDNWYSMSLRASMSNDLLLDDVFIPDVRAVAPRADGLSETPQALRVPPNASISPPCIVLGIAQAAIRDTIEYAKGHSMSIGGRPRSVMPGNQFAIANATMLVESARAFLMQESQAIVTKANNGESFNRTDTMRLRMAGQVARENTQKAVEGLWSIRGSHGLYESEGFERYYRDVRIGTLPAPSTPEYIREQVGKYLFDIPADVQPRWG